MQAARSEASKLLRALLFTVGFALGAAVVWLAAVRAVELSGAPGIALALDLVDHVNALVRKLRENHGPDRIAFIGDSTCMGAHGMTDPVGQALPGRGTLAMQGQG